MKGRAMAVAAEAQQVVDESPALQISGAGQYALVKECNIAQDHFFFSHTENLYRVA